MDREILLRRLAQVEQMVSEGRAFIAEQQRRVVKSERDGDDAVEILRLLEKFLKLHQAVELNRARLLDELSEMS